MRPTPAEMIEGVTRILRETVQPAVGDEHAGAQLAQVITVLRGFDPDGVSEADARRRDAAQALLRECRAWCDADAARRDAFVDDVDADDIDAALTRFIEQLGAWRTTHGTADSDELFTTIGTVLATRT